MGNVMSGEVTLLLLSWIMLRREARVLVSGERVFGRGVSIFEREERVLVRGKRVLERGVSIFEREVRGMLCCEHT